MNVEEVYKSVVERFEAEGRLRRLSHPGAEDLLDCTSNDYMGLGANEDLLKAFVSTIDMDPAPFGSCASRLLFTGVDRYGALEDFIGRAYGRDALLFNSGYHANTGIIPALCAPGETLIVADKLVHASIIDGMRLSGAPFRRFRHNDVESLKSILEKEAKDYARVLVVVESIYSMDGDEAPLREIDALRKSFPGMMLYVDEAHAFGVRGKLGLGVCDELGIKPDILIGTLGKAAASAGAFAVTSPVLKNYLVNTCRSLIFSTALPPVSVDWSLFTLGLLRNMDEEREALAAKALYLSSFLVGLTGKGEAHTSPIIPLFAGSNERAVAMACVMRKHGVLALPIRRPTVGAGTERIRISLNASMTNEEIDRIKRAAEYAIKEAGVI